PQAPGGKTTIAAAGDVGAEPGQTAVARLAQDEPLLKPPSTPGGDFLAFCEPTGAQRRAAPLLPNIRRSQAVGYFVAEPALHAADGQVPSYSDIELITP